MLKGLSLSVTAEDFHLLHRFRLDLCNLKVSHLKVAYLFVKTLLASALARKAEVGEYVDLCDTVLYGVAEIVVGKTATAVKNERRRNGVADFLNTLEVELGRKFVCAVRRTYCNSKCVNVRLSYEVRRLFRVGVEIFGSCVRMYFCVGVCL